MIYQFNVRLIYKHSQIIYVGTIVGNKTAEAFAFNNESEVIIKKYGQRI